jgi:hypothetical protein
MYTDYIVELRDYEKENSQVKKIVVTHFKVLQRMRFDTDISVTRTPYWEYDLGRPEQEKRIRNGRLVAISCTL